MCCISIERPVEQGYNLQYVFSLVTITSLLQSSMSNHDHLTKFFIRFGHLFNFLMASRCIWPFKIEGLWGAEVPIVGKPTSYLTTLTPPPVFAFWLASFKGSHQEVSLQASSLRGGGSCSQVTRKLLKDVTKFSKTNQKLCNNRYVMMNPHWAFLVSQYK